MSYLEIYLQSHFSSSLRMIMGKIERLKPKWSLLKNSRISAFKDGSSPFPLTYSFGFKISSGKVDFLIVANIFHYKNPFHVSNSALELERIQFPFIFRCICLYELCEDAWISGSAFTQLFRMTIPMNHCLSEISRGEKALGTLPWLRVSRDSYHIKPLVSFLKLCLENLEARFWYRR